VLDALTYLCPKAAEGPLRVLVLCRTSLYSPPVKNRRTRQPSTEQWLESEYGGEMEIKCLRDRASGGKSYRPGLHAVEAAVATGEWDALCLPDLGRFSRDPDDHRRLVDLCDEHLTRLIILDRDFAAPD